MSRRAVYFLDTDHFGILQLRDGDLYAALRARLDRHDRVEFAVSIVSFHEQLNGWQAYRALVQWICALQQLHSSATTWFPPAIAWTSSMYLD